MSTGAIVQTMTRETKPEFTVNHRQITRGTEVKVDGFRGRCVFLAYTHTDTGLEWVDVLTARGFSRTVRPERILTVHRDKQLRWNA